MYFDTKFTKENLNTYLKEVAKEFRRRSGTKMPAEIILIGGAAILANYGFREMTYDIDAIIIASSAMKEAINSVGDRFGLPNGWLNMDFNKTQSYSTKLSEVSVYYKTFSNVCTVRTIAAEYLIAMKLMSGREYKNDLSDVAGVLWEHQKTGNAIDRETVEKAIEKLYGENAELPESSQKFITIAFSGADYECVYKEIRHSEKVSREILVNIEEDYPNTLKQDNVSSILELARKKRDKEHLDNKL
ncbi:hypothetical protein AGMMS50284_4750 [Clostridia bacterium]|nr:hypothetical protein AGMMS50284_4750 [Clostridia bacterium]